MKLILINGPTGIGKSTIAQKLQHVLPLSFLLDIDAQRRYISGYKEHRDESLDLVMKLSYAVIETALQNGRDVVIDKVLTDTEVSERFLELGRKYDAAVFEFVLNADKETLIARANQRGYIEGSMLTPEKVPEFWDRIQSYLIERPDAIVIDTKSMSPDDTFEYIRGKIFDKD
jgi:predicted kinase